MGWTVNQISKLSKISTDSLRYYDKMGIISPKRKENGYRYYDERDLILLKYTTVMKYAQFSLAEIKLILNSFGKEPTDDCNKINREILSCKHIELSAKIKNFKTIVNLIETALSMIHTKNDYKENEKSLMNLSWKFIRHWKKEFLKMNKKVLLSILSIATVTFATAEASSGSNNMPIRAGFAAAYSQSPYKAYDNRIKPYPLLNYKQNKFFIRGKEAGFEIFKKGSHKMDLSLSYYDLEFKNKNTSNDQTKMLDNRKSTLTADIAYSFISPSGIARLKTSFDILNHSNGLLLDLSYCHPLKINKRFQFNPGLGIEWANKKQNDYYYSISQHEALKSGLPQYRADSGFSPYIFLEANYNLSKKFDVFIAGRLNFLSSEIKDSPMTNKSKTASLALGLQYNF